MSNAATQESFESYMSNPHIPDVDAKASEQAQVKSGTEMSTREKLAENADVIFWKLYFHGKRQAVAWVLAAVVMYMFQANYKIGFNRTESLPYTVFLVHMGEKVKRGDIVAFSWDGGGKHAWMSPFKPGATMVKYMLGVPGDEVASDKDGNMYVRGMAHAPVKPFTKNGKPLTPLLAPGEMTKIPEHHYYLGTPHKDGMDSRYEMVGLVDESRMIGKVYAIF